MTEFVDGLREAVTRNGANLLNVTIRIVHKDNITALPYARQDMFAFVLYFNLKFNEKESRILEQTTTDLIDVVLRLNGTYYPTSSFTPGSSCSRHIRELMVSLRRRKNMIRKSCSATSSMRSTADDYHV